MKKHLLLLSALKPHHLNRIPACYEYRLKTPDSVNEEDIRWAEVIAGKVPLTYLPNPIWKETNVILTPHISGTFQLSESFERYVNILIQNLEAYAQGKALCNLVNIKEGY